MGAIEDEDITKQSKPRIPPNVITEQSGSQTTLMVAIYEGRDLVPKDKNKKGNKSSDPYVEIYYGDVKMGKTSVIKKDLNPNWGGENFTLNICQVSSTNDLKPIECRIFDYDMMSGDDCMGVVQCVTSEMFNDLVVGWHTVGKGEGKYYCKNASGRLKLGLELRTASGTVSRISKTVATRPDPTMVKKTIENKMESRIEGAQCVAPPEEELEERSMTATEKSKINNGSETTLMVVIYEGRDLVTKDPAIWGNRSSDPYVEIYYGDVKVGKSTVIKKDLNPNWGGETYTLNIGKVSIDDVKPIECRIFDYDTITRHDRMGVVQCETPEMFNELVVGWHTVGKGEGKYYCKNASGRLKLGLKLQSL